MFNLVLSFTASFVVIYLIVLSSHLHGSMSMDQDMCGVQKNHAYAVPRIGGVGIALAATITFSAEPIWVPDSNTPHLLLLLCATPAFAAGLVEDMTKRVTPRFRLMSALLSALVASIALHAVLTRVDIPFIDQWLRIAPMGIFVTAVGIAGFTHAVNIIDGFNGLASVVALLIFASIAYVAHDAGDWIVVSVALTMIGAIGGFVLWNFPTPSVFLGDGGAYLVGFVAAELMLLLIVRHPNLSAWYPLTVAIYPTFETLFSVYRRRILRGKPAGDADGLHLHTLVYRRIVRKNLNPHDLHECTRRNSITSVYLWALSLISILPATCFPNSRIVLAITSAVFVAVYCWLYSSIVHMRTPHWLMRTNRSPVVANEPRN